MFYKEGVPVTWDSSRQREVAIAAGYRVRGGRVENLEARGSLENGDTLHRIIAVRPASLAEQAFWSLLMSKEGEWNTSSN